MQEPDLAFRRSFMPRRFAPESETAVEFHEHAPAGRNFRIAKQRLRKHEKKQICAAPANEFFKFGAIGETSLQCAQLARQPVVSAVTDRGEVSRIEFGKKRFSAAQTGVVRAQACFERLATLNDPLQPLACGFGMTIIPSQVAERLFAFKDSRGRGCGKVPLSRLRKCACVLPSQSERSDVGPVRAIRQTHLRCASQITLRLRPKNGQTLQLCVSRRLAVGLFYSCSHPASSRAQ